MPPLEDVLFATLSHGLSNLYTDGLLCDLAVEVGKTTFSCHKVVLAAMSEYFHRALCAGSGTGLICIQDDQVIPEAFSTILDILYKRKDCIQDCTTAITILKAAAFLKMRFLIDLCIDFLCSNFDKFQNLDSYLSLSKQCLFHILSSHDLVVSNEDSVCKVLLKWVDHDLEQRRGYLPEFLPFVQFSSMSEPYLWELHKLSFTSNAEMFDYIQEALLIKIETAERINSVKKAEILSCQERCTQSNKLRRLPVIINSKSYSHFVSLKMIPSYENITTRTVSLQAPQEDCGSEFSSCVWRNELYISGGSQKARNFAVYNSGLNDWTALPDLPKGREKHAMAGINWNIYILGGLEEQADGQKVSASPVMTYNVKSKTWSVVANLYKAVYEAGATVLGHVIYIFGGRVEGHVTDLVQCLNTLTGSVYLAGKLPSPTCRPCPVVSSSTLYLVRGEGDVLEMKGCCSFDEDSRTSLAGKNEKQKNEVTIDTLSPMSDTVHTAKNTSEQKHADLPVYDRDRDMKDSTNETTENKQQGVRFVPVAHIKEGQYFGACLKGNIIEVFGDQSSGMFQDLDLITTAKIDLNTMKVSNTPTPSRSSTYFNLHLMNFPEMTTVEAKTIDFQFTFQPDALAKGAKITSHMVRLDRIYWYVECRNSRNAQLSCQLCAKESQVGGNNAYCRENTKYSFWILPTRLLSKNYCGEFSISSNERRDKTLDSKILISMKELTDPENCLLKDGKVTIRVTITVP